MSRTAKEIARDARAAYYAKYKKDDIQDAAEVVRAFLRNPVGNDRRAHALDAFQFVLDAWNVAEDEGAEGICRTCGEACMVEDQKWVHTEVGVDEDADHLAEPEDQ